MRIQHNIPAMNSLTNYTRNNNALAANLEKLSSGYRINSAADDAAGLAISEKMRSQIKGLEQAYNNANDGISLVQTAEGALTEVNSMLTRLTELATQSANGTYQDDVDRAAIQEETDAILDEIDRISKATNYNGINLLDGSLGNGAGTVSGGIKLQTADAVAGEFTLATIAAGTTAYAATDIGKTFEYTVEWLSASGESKNTTVKFTVKGGEADGSWTAGGKNYLQLEDGSTLELTSGKATAASVADAIVDALKSDSEFNDNFKITSAANATAIKIAARKAGGTDVAVISGTTTRTVDETGAVLDTSNSGTVTSTGAGANATIDTAGTDAMQYFEGAGLKVITSASSATSDPSDYEKAVFEINGKKFALVENDLNKATTDTIAKQLGSDVTLIELKAAAFAAADDGEQLAAEIARVTGLATKHDAGKIYFTEDTLSTAGEHAPLTLQVGDTNDSFQKVSVAIDDMSSKGLGLTGLDLSDQDKAGDAIKTIKAAVNKVSAQRGRLGALQNRLDHTLNNLDATTENITSAESQIRDVNMAKEMTAYTKNNILAQAAQSMLAQANSMPQGVLQLLQ